MIGKVEVMETTEHRGPGRPRKFHEQFQAPAADTAAPASELTDTRRPNARKPFGSMNFKLDYPSREGFHRHWFNDIPGRVSRALEAGYEHVKGTDDKPVSRNVGVAEGGGALTAFLMEIPEELYKEDMLREQTLIDQKEEMMRRGELDKQEKSYVPAQGISIKTGK